MRIFADANVLVSAFTARGLCADLLEIILADHQLMTGEVVLQELQRVLTTKLKVPKRKVSDVLQFLHNHHVEPKPDKPSEIKVRNEDDRWILESAIRAKASILATGDKDLLDISNQVPQLRIVTPRRFWELLQK